MSQDGHTHENTVKWQRRHPATQVGRLIIHYRKERDLEFGVEVCTLLSSRTTGQKVWSVLGLTQLPVHFFFKVFYSLKKYHSHLCESVNLTTSGLAPADAGSLGPEC